MTASTRVHTLPFSLLICLLAALSIFAGSARADDAALDPQPAAESAPAEQAAVPAPEQPAQAAEPAAAPAEPAAAPASEQPAASPEPATAGAPEAQPEAVAPTLKAKAKAKAKGSLKHNKGLSAQCTRAQEYVTAHPNGKFARQARKFLQRHCDPQAPEATQEILSVTSNASCSVTIEGTSIAAFEHINMDFDQLLVLPGGVYLSYLRVYQPGSALNFDTTTVTVDVSDTTTITITDPAICGKPMIVTSMLFDGGSGVAWYETVNILP